MSGESSKRSNLIDVTYQQLHAILCGQVEGVTSTQLFDYFIPRFNQLRSISEPFGKPSDASRNKVKGGSVVLEDGVIIRLEDVDKDFVYAISQKFQIDEIQALVLLRSFLYNEGLSSTDSDKSIVDELVEAITPFYFSERLHIIRVLIPLFRAQEQSEGIIHEVAAEILPKIVPNGKEFVSSLVKEYLRKAREKLSPELSSNPRMASKWAKQNKKEQLVLLELLFWTMWEHVPCDGPLVLQIYQAAYSTDLGSTQQNRNLLLDQESVQLQQDCAAMWIMITIEILELETIAGKPNVEISDNPVNPDFYTASPTCLQEIHNLVTSNENSQHACAYLGWAFVLSRIVSTATQMKEVPDSYQGFLRSIISPARSKEREPLYMIMAKTCLDQSVGFFNLILSLLTQSPLFVTSVAWHTGSTVTDPNAIAFRSVIKGLVVALVELVQVEMIPDFDSFVEVWVALFGRSESQSVSGICRQFWESDWNHGIARRAIFDVARSRFPIQVKPLVKLLRASTALGFLDTDPLSTADHSHDWLGLSPDRELCDRQVFFYFDALPSFSHVIPLSACTGPNALYEKVHERYGSSSSVPGLAYSNLRPIKLPGGSILPAKSKGTVLSNDGSDVLVICWQHEHSGWRLILEILSDYVNRKHIHAGTHGYREVSFDRKGGNQKAMTLKLSDIGVEGEEDEDDEMIIEILDLIRSLMQDNPTQTQELMEALEAAHKSAIVPDSQQHPDLVQVTTMILESSLSRSDARKRSNPSRTRLITSAMSVLSALLTLPTYSNRVWLYIRSTAALFGTDRTAGFASVALSAERMTGHYTMTLALLHLVQQLFQQASSAVLADTPRLHQVKEEVLLRAVRFVHTEVWVEHLGWKYAQVGDRFEIGRRVTSLYADILQHSPPTLQGRPFTLLSQTVIDALLFKATTSTINPLVSSIGGGGSLLRTLYSARRYDDSRRLIFLLESHLRLARMILNFKQKSAMVSKLCLLEQALCARISNSFASESSSKATDCVDVLANYVKERDLGSVVPLEAAKVLSSLCSSLSNARPSPPSVIGHLSNAEATVAAFVRIIQHPYDDMALRNAVWNFIIIAVDKEPALAALFVTGRNRSPLSIRGEEKETEKGKETNGKTEQSGSSVVTAVQVAVDVVSNWSEMWELNPQLLVSVMRFLDVVWKHGLEHSVVLDDTRKNGEFWGQVVSMACEELGPVPEYRTYQVMEADGPVTSNLHEGVALHAFRTEAKACALSILSSDISIHFQKDTSPSSQPLSFKKIESYFKSEDQFMDLISEAAPSSYDPEIYDALTVRLKTELPSLTLEQLESQEPVDEREYGDDYAFSSSLLRHRMQSSAADMLEAVLEQLQSINLNLSLTSAQNKVAEAWTQYLLKAVPFLRNNATVRPIVLNISATVSAALASEKRTGDMMATIYGSRLSLLLSLLEVAWFFADEKKNEVTPFMELVRNTHDIIVNEPQSPSRSFLGTISVPFHRTLLQIVYYCAKCCRVLNRKQKALTAEHRLAISSMLDASLSLIVDALRVVFVSARTRLDVELDRDMQLLVCVFEQCTWPDLNTSPVHWLARCQELDLINSSLDLFAHTDLVGLSDIPGLLIRKQPLYAPYISLFHLILASIPSAAERLASESVLSAYSNNCLSSAISSGRVDVTIPELPGERSPAHSGYCSMLAVVSGVVRALGRHNHYFDAEACGFIQLYGQQISRCLSWTIGEALTMPLLEEMEQTVSLFHSIAESRPSSANASPTVDKVLRAFTERALMLLQQLNYALTHPNHLASLLETVTGEERSQLDKESSITEPRKRPLVGSLMYRLFRLAGNVLMTLISASRAFDVLLGDQDNWPVHEVLLIPHSKVVVGEPASLGTLIEFGNCTLDVLRDVLQAPKAAIAGPTTGQRPPKGSAEIALDAQYEIGSLRRLLESILIYTVTQLTMFLSKSELSEANGGDMVTDDDLPPLDSHRPAGKDKGRSGRGPRQSLALDERVKRGMTGEMATDLQGLLAKVKPVMEKAETVTSKDGGKCIDLTKVLIRFLSEHVAS